MSESLPRGFDAHVAAEAQLNESLADQANRDAIESRALSVEGQQLNYIAQAEIWGTGGQTKGLRDPVTGGPLKEPIKGLVNEIREDPNYGNSAEREAKAQAYEDDINLLRGGENGLELCQAKLIMDLRQRDKAESVKMLTKFVAKGMSLTEAASKVSDIYDKKDYNRKELIKNEGIFTAKDYVAKLKKESEQPKKAKVDTPKNPTETSEAPTEVKEPADKPADKKEESERYAYDQSAISWVRHKRAPEFKKRVAGRRLGRLIGGLAMAADYAVGTNTWNPGLYEKYTDEKKTSKATPTKADGKTPPTSAEPSARGSHPPAPPAGSSRRTTERTKTETPETYKHMDRIQYKDGEMALLFQTHGDIMDLSNGSKFKYAQALISHGSNDVAIARAEDGSSYVVGKGLIIDQRNGAVREIAKELEDITLGEAWKLPDGSLTSRINQLEFRYKTTTKGAEDKQIDELSPYPDLLEQLRAAREALDLRMSTAEASDEEKSEE